MTDIYQISPEEYKIYILMKKEFILIGKTLPEASEILRNCIWRIVKNDDVEYEYNRDYNTNRYNLYIENRIIVKVIMI